jgi:hypothetical protein
MQRESRSNYILRRMQESKMNTQSSNDDIVLKLSEENNTLRNNVKELQEQLKNAYVNIKENDTGNPEIWHYYDRGSHLKFVDGKLVADLIQLEFDI